MSNRTVESTVLAFGSPFVQNGSLRDVIYRVDDPLVQKHSMYGRGGRPVKFKKLRIWGRQILEGLIALKEHGFTYIPLHSGNVMVLSDSAGSYRVVIAGWESAVFGSGLGDGLGRLVQKTVSLAEAEYFAVVFGYLFFEMAFGIEMLEHKPNYTGLSSSRRRWNSPIRRILDLIFEGGWITPNEEPFSDDDLVDEDQKSDHSSSADNDEVLNTESEIKDEQNSTENSLEVDKNKSEIDVEEVFDSGHDSRKSSKKSNRSNSTRNRYGKGIVTIEEVAELSFFQFTEDENVDIKSNPIQLPEGVLDSNDVKVWKDLLKKCCFDASFEGKERQHKRAKESARTLKPRSPSRKGRYKRIRKTNTAYKTGSDKTVDNGNTANKNLNASEHSENGQIQLQRIKMIPKKIGKLKSR